MSEFDIDKEIDLIRTHPALISLNEIPDGLLERVRNSLARAVTAGRKLQRELSANRR